MKWLIQNEIFIDAWEAAGYVAESMNGGEYGADTSDIFNHLEQMHDNEESEVNGYRVTSYLVYE